MILLVSLFDKKASAYEPPIAFPNLAQALRQHANLFLRNPNSNYVQYAADFDLYLVAEFDEQTGGVVEKIPPQFLDSMVNLGYQVNQKKNDNGLEKAMKEGALENGT